MRSKINVQSQEDFPNNVKCGDDIKAFIQIEIDKYIYDFEILIFYAEQ